MNDVEPIKRGPGRPRKPTEQAEAPSQPEQAGRTAKMRILRGYWPASGGKLKPGEVADLPIDEARSVLAQRIAERADEL